ncbi:MAG: bifunctional riboflavin kinase/FAD synthetase [Anaerolineaceae bacterium]
MPHYHTLDALHLPDTWLTIGFFDGVHRGHQTLLHGMSAEARAAGATTAVITFYPHPGLVLRGESKPIYLTTPDERAARLQASGVDAVITLPFTRDLANMTAREFMEMVCKAMRLRQLWVGYDFSLGRGREGTVPVLATLGETLGYTVRRIEPVLLDGEVISSSRIRGLLGDGNVSEAERLLGYPYSVEGAVIHGDGRGHHLGFPTANIDVWSEQLLPRKGVYAGWLIADDKRYPAVTNVGIRPTFATGDRAWVEAYAIDFHRDLYGKQVRFEFIEFLRGEQRFSNVETLLAQIQKDVERAKGILTDERPATDLSAGSKAAQS